MCCGRRIAVTKPSNLAKTSRLRAGFRGDNHLPQGLGHLKIVSATYLVRGPPAGHFISYPYAQLGTGRLLAPSEA